MLIGAHPQDLTGRVEARLTPGELVLPAPFSGNRAFPWDSFAAPYVRADASYYVVAVDGKFWYRAAMTTPKRYPKKANWRKNLTPEQIAARDAKRNAARDAYNTRVREALEALKNQSQRSAVHDS